MTSRTAAIENIAIRTGNTLTPATLAAGSGGLVLSAATDIVNTGSTIRSAGAMLLQAARDVRNEAYADKLIDVSSTAAADTVMSRPQPMDPKLTT